MLTRFYETVIITNNAVKGMRQLKNKSVDLRQFLYGGGSLSLTLEYLGSFYSFDWFPLLRGGGGGQSSYGNFSFF